MFKYIVGQEGKQLLRLYPCWKMGLNHTPNPLAESATDIEKGGAQEGGRG